MGLGILIVGLAVFLATHVFVSFREARASVIERVGLSLYRTLFAIVSLVGLALIIWGYAQYRAHDLIQLWSPPAFMRHITIGLVFFAAIFIVAAFCRRAISAPSSCLGRSWLGAFTPVSLPSAVATLARQRRLLRMAGRATSSSWLSEPQFSLRSASGSTLT
jgi:hypothetical protein